MKIAIIAPPWVAVPPSGYGGTETVLDTLAQGLQAAGAEVLLYTTADSTCPVPKAWVLPRAVGTAATTPATELHHVVNAYQTILEWQPDVIHDHTLVGPLYAARFDIPVVTTNHGPFQGENEDLYRVLSADTPIIAISHHHAATAGSIPIAGTIHHGVNLDDFPEGAGQGGYALFLGRMAPEKGVHLAIRVARKAGVPLKIAAKMAEPDEFSYFATYVEPLLGGNIEYLGEVGGDAKHQLLADAICLLNPIRWPEPFGMVIIEALASGTPVISTPSGSVPELVDDGVTGFICNTELALVDALARVQLLDRRYCRAAVRRRFSAERMVADHLHLYQSVIENQRMLQVV